jgi:hypothetical protein
MPMKVLRIVTNIGTLDLAGLRQFYRTLFGLDVVMDLGWIVTLSSGASMPMQLNPATDGGSGALDPDMSIELDDVEDEYNQANAQDVPIIYDLKG